MYAPTPSSIGGGGRMPPSHQEFINSHSGRHASGGTATPAVPWDSDSVAYVGMEYSNKGACSQKRSAAVDFYAGGGTAATGRGCSQNKAAAPAAYLNMNSDGSIRGYYDGSTYDGVSARPQARSGGFGAGASSSCRPPSATSTLTTTTTVVQAASPPPPPRSCSAASTAAPGRAPTPDPHHAARLCQVEGCEEPAFRIDDRSPGVLCQRHLQDGMQRVAHNDRIYGTHRSSLCPEDIARPMYEHKYNARASEAPARAPQPEGQREPSAAAAEVIPVSKSDPELSEQQQQQQQQQVERRPVVVGEEGGPSGVERAQACEYPGCENSPRYGHKDGPETLCQIHKKAGMYTARDGKLLMATRDGSAIRKAAAPRAVGPKATPSKKVAKRAPKPERAADSSEGPRPDDPACRSPSLANFRVQTMYRKLCEVEGCLVQPSYGLSGTSRPRFCREHKSKGMVGLKNRPCLFPGCTTRPHYGLSRGRAMYCASHKKDGMVHLLKESLNMEKERIARNRELSRKSVAERKRREAAARANGNGNGNGNGGNEQDPAEEEEQSELGGRRSKGDGEDKCDDEKEVDSGSKKRKKGAAGGAKGGGKAAMSSSSAGYISSAAAAATLSSWHSQDEDGEGEYATASSGWGGGRHGAGMTPCVEMKLLQQAREAARVAAESSGSGRRARAPSRRLLEATGVLESEGAQWMTTPRGCAKEQPDAKVNVKKELIRERQKQQHLKASAAAAGKAGEAASEGWLAPPGALPAPGADGAAATTAAAGTGAWEAGGSGDGGTASASVKKATAATAGWPSRGSSSSGSGNADKVKTPPARTWVVSDGGRSKNRGSSGGGGDAASRKRSTAAEGDAAAGGGTKHKRTKRDGDEANGDAPSGNRNAWEGVCGGVAGGKALCEYGDCSKTARYGVNGTVRYCKSHKLFGMHEIRQT